jgi:GTP-dependent dephospho-CoA kinase
MKKINEKVMNDLKSPWGEIYKTKELIEKIKSRKVIAIGDICAHKLIEKKVIPHICIYDGLTQRKKVSSKLKNFFEEHYKRIIIVENKAGTINPLAEFSLKNLIESKSSGAINIKGEEDLLTLVAMMHLPKDYVVVYGQPKKGAVLVEYSEDVKKKAKKIYDEMSNF